MTLISEATEEVILVSPYVNITNWQKMKKCLKTAVDRGISVRLFVRKDTNNNHQPFLDLGIPVTPVTDLHAKLYLNDSWAIATSQNLIEYSDINSIDFAYETENAIEYRQLRQLIENYVEGKRPVKAVRQVNAIDVVAEPVTPVLSDSIKLSRDAVSVIYESLKEQFLSVRINKTATYVYATEIFSFGDLMLREGFEIRLQCLADHTEKQVLKALEDITFEGCTYEYKKKRLDRDYGPAYIRFTPQSPTSLDILIQDYIKLVWKIQQESKHIKVSGMAM
jgi:hypothetical protein